MNLLTHTTGHVFIFQVLINVECQGYHIHLHIVYKFHEYIKQKLNELIDPILCSIINGMFGKNGNQLGCAYRK